MPNTHLSLYCHTVFSTKNRVPDIKEDWRPRLHSYLGGCARNVEAVPLEVGGVGDHVHILFSLKATHRLSDVMRNVKVASSQWVHSEIGKRSFAWQDGYGAFSVSPSNVEQVKAYIRNQEEHHRTRTFEEEYVRLLDKNGVAYDPRYLW